MFGSVQGAAWAANRWLVSSMFEQFGASGPSEVVDVRTARLLALLFALLASFRMAKGRWGARQSTQAWKKGYEGEVRTAQQLDSLPEDHVVLHDLRMPGSRANIDDIVIGPTGVFTVETKNYSSDVTIRHGKARHAGRSMDSVVAQANGQAAAVRRALGCEVRAIVCIQGAGVAIEGWFSKPVVAGVRFCSGACLRKVLSQLPDALNSAEVERLADAARAGLRPATSRSPSAVPARPADRGACSCGGRLVLRHRRSDGGPFLGCDRFPVCRRIRPA